MILNDDLQFLWVHATKSGGVSMRAALEPLQTDPTRPERIVQWIADRYPGYVNQQNIYHGAINPTHTPAWAIKEALIGMGEYSESDWDRLEKFIVLRNPWDHMHSLYAYETSNEAHPRYDEVHGMNFIAWVQARINTARDIFRREEINPTRRRMPEYFTTRLINEDPEGPSVVHDFQFLMFDRLANDFASLAHYLNQKAAVQDIKLHVNPELPHMNASGPPNDFIVAWNLIPAMARWVQEIYSPDIDYFGWQPHHLLNVPPGQLREVRPRIPQQLPAQRYLLSHARNQRDAAKNAANSSEGK